MTTSSQTNPAPELLFVYGTLRRNIGHPMAMYLALHATWRCLARAPGRLYDFGNYPGMVEANDPIEWVAGDLYEMTEPIKLLVELDKYEGCVLEEPQPYIFRRSVTNVVLEDKTSAKAWVYYYVGTSHENQRVLSGDYWDVISNR